MDRERFDQLPMRHVFIDESCQNAHQFMVIGALVLPGPVANAAEVELGRRLEQMNMHAELKWTKVSRGKLDAYRATVDFYFDELVPHGAEYHALIVNSHDVDHRSYNQGDADLGFNKFLFSLLYFRVGKPFGFYERIVVDFDSRNSTRELSELQQILNFRMARDNADPLRASFARLAWRDSKRVRLLQLADLLAGAVAWHKNSHDLAPGSSVAKSALAHHIAGRLGLFRLGWTSPAKEKRLSCWNFALRPPKRGRPAA